MTFDSSAATPPLDSPPSTREQAALRLYVRRKLVRAVVVLLALIVGVGIASVWYEAELFLAAHWVYEHVGLSGILAILFTTDTLVSPFPPDLLLLVVAKSALHTHWLSVIGAMGVLSALAGNVGWFLGRHVGGTRSAQRVLRHFRVRDQKLVARYGRWGIVLGALTPIPFSVTCWAAGLLHLPFAQVFWPTLLRIPRFFAYYAAIAWADDLTRLLF